MSRIEKKFREIKKKKGKALIVYMTAGDPSLNATESLIHAFEREGVDLIELGVPFSDPLADGPVIQEASNRSLARGTTLRKILEVAARARKKSQIPLLLMTYLNPILALGTASFAKAAKNAGVDGVIIPDLPPDEEKGISSLFRKNGIDLVYLLAPTSTPERRRRVARASRGFVYYVSITGVTGARQSVLKEVKANVRAIRKTCKIPVCVGFGISNPRQAKEISSVSDGVIVGSAVVKALAGHRGDAAGFARRFIRPFAKAVHA